MYGKKNKMKKNLIMKKSEDVNDSSVSINNNIIYKYHFKMTLCSVKLVILFYHRIISSCLLSTYYT